MFYDRWVHELSPIPVFVRHRWNDPENPDADLDFTKLKNLLTYVVACALQASISLAHAGFPLDALLRFRPFMRPAFRVSAGPSWDPEGESIKFIESSLQVISGQLAQEIFALTAHTVIDRWAVYEKNRDNDYIRDRLQK